MVIGIMLESVILVKKLKLNSRLYLLVVMYYFIGFLLWNIDNQFCNHLKSFRQFIDKYIDSKSSLESLIMNSALIVFKSISEFHSLWYLRLIILEFH